SLKRLPAISLSTKKVKDPGKRLTLLGLGILLIVVLFFRQQGGIINWLISWGIGGRRAAMEGYGPILKLFSVAYFVPLAWYLWKGIHVIKNPVWWVFVIIFLPLGFAATGSRSSVFIAIIGFGIAYLMRNGKIPYLIIVPSAVAGVILLGLLGQIRSASTYNDGNIDEANTDLSVEGNLSYAREDLDSRSALGPNIAIFHKVPDEVPWLYGKTYVGALSFFIPRLIWKEKPHAAGYYTGRDIFDVKYGIPPSDIAESYWNFGWLGPFIMASLFGLFLRFIANMHVVNYSDPSWQTIYIIIITSALAFSSLALTTMLQQMVWVIGGLKIIGLR
ncbi:MAG: O-antigen polysaccharide polymerase Wzy, partial [Bacteroidota bacterium]